MGPGPASAGPGPGRCGRGVLVRGAGRGLGRAPWADATHDPTATKARRSHLTGALAAYGLDAPGVRDRLAGFQGEQVGAGNEGVRRAGHRLDGYGAAPVSAVERVPGEGLEPAVTRPGPQRGPGPAAGQPGPRPASLVAVQLGEGVIQRHRPHRPR